MSPTPQQLRFNLALGVVCSLIVSAASSRAADRFWSGATADYTNTTWTGGVVPGATDNAINDHGIGNAVQISVGNPDWTVGQIRAGNSVGNGAFVQNGQNVTALGTNYNGPVITEFFTPFRLGIVAANSGVYTMNGGVLNYGNGPFNVGEVGTGTLNLNGGDIIGNGVFFVNSGSIAVPNPAVLTGTAGHGPFLGDFTYYEQGYSATHPTTGLPAPGTTITSVTQGDHSYKFAPSYTANDAVILDAAVPTATITLATPTVCSALSFMGSAGNGPVTNNYAVHYASGADDTGTLIIPDWFGSGQEVLNIEGRVDALGANFQFPGTAGGNPVGNAPYLLSVDIPLVNTDKVVSISLTYVGGNGNSFATATIFGVSGEDVVGNPFSPLTISGYNADVVVEAAAPSPNVSTSVADTVTQTGGTNTINNQLFIAQGPTSHGTYNFSNGEIDIQSWTVIGRNGGQGVFNMTGGTINKFANGGNFVIGSASGDNSLAGTVGTLNQSGGTINLTSEYWIAENSLTTATNNISGNAVVNLHNWMSIGRGGLGVLNISGNATITQDVNNWQTGDGGNAIVNQSGGTNNVFGELHVALNSGHFATYNMSGGVLNAHNWFQVGRGGAALLNFTGGTINKTDNGAFIIADNATDSARVIQTGAGTLFNCQNDFWIGNNATAELDLTNGTLITGTLIDGNNGFGTFEQSGGNVTANGQFWVGQATGGAGSIYDLSGGGTIAVHDWVSIGRNGGSGTVNLVSGSISKSGNGNFSIGGDGGATGVLNQSAGTSLSVTSGNVTYLGQGGGHGTWEENGGTANLGVLTFCDGDGSGLLDLNGGTVTALEVNCVTNVDNATFNFNGGTLQAAGNNANFMHDILNVNMNATAVIDSQNFSIGVVQNLPNNGGIGTSGLTKIGLGTLTLMGTNTYTGATLVNQGILGNTTTASTTSSGYAVADGAGLSVQVAGALNSQISVSNVAFGVSSATTADFDLGGFGNPTVAPLNIINTLAVNGTVTVNIADATPALGQVPLIKYAAKTGAGTFTVGTLPTGVTAFISNNVANQSIDLVISGLNQPRWDGEFSANWDTGTETNWVNIGTGLPTFYTDPSKVVFDDNALGATNVNLPGTVNPLGVTVNNSNLIYTFNGPGKISGSYGLTKLGSGVLNLVNSNNYTGPTVVANGTLNVATLANFGTSSPLGAAGANPTNLVFAGGALNYSGPAITLNRPYTTAAGVNPSAFNSVNNVTFTSLVSGNGGEFQKQGPSQLAYVAQGSNDLTGYQVGGSTFRVRGGSVLLDGSAGQTNYIRNLYLGYDGGVDTSMTLTNTTLWVRNNLIIGQTNANATMTLTNSTLNFEGQSNPLEVGDAGGSPVNAVFNQANSTVNLPSGNQQLFVGNNTNAIATYNLSSGAINVHNWVVIGRNGATGTFNMTGGTITHDNNAFIISSANNSVGTLNQSGGTLNAVGGAGYWLSEHPGDVATNNITGSSLLVVSSDFKLGDGGLGVVNLTNGAVIHKTNPDNSKRFYIGNFNNGAGGNGTLNQYPGTTLTCDSDLDIGNANGGSGTTGTFNLMGGTVHVGNVNASSWFTIGRDGSGGTATYNQSGGTLEAFGELHVAEAGWTSTMNISGGLLIPHSWFQIGRNGGGTALLNMTGGAIHHLGGNGTMIIGDQNPNLSQIIQTGGYITNDDQTWIGNNCSGLFNQSGGTNVMNGEFWVGQQSGSSEYDISGTAMLTVGSWLPVGRAGATGVINMSGGSITKTGTSGEHVSVGDGGPGTVNQTAGTFTSVLSDTYLGAGGTGIWNLSGSGSVFLNTLVFNRDNGSSGTMNLNGGTITVAGIRTNGATGATGTFNFNGGTLAASANNAAFMQGLTTADVQAGGAVIDSGANSIAIGQALLDGGGGGGLTKLGAGALFLNGVNTYTGSTLVSAGTLGGNGTIAGPVVVSAGATFSPGPSAIGTLTLGNTLSLAGTSTTVIEVNKTANTSDLVTGATSVTYGGTLILKNLSGALQPGDTFTVFSAGGYSGSFSSVISQTPNQTVTWDLSQLAVNGTVKVASAVLAPVNLTPTVVGGRLTFGWPLNQIGWQLQHQVNPLTVGISTNWSAVAGSTGTNAVSLPLDSTEATEFFRLVFPAQ